VAEPTTFVRSEEQRMLASTLRDLLASTTDMDRTRELSLATDAMDNVTWKAISEMGLAGLALPSAYGGADSTTTDLAIVFEELGRVVAAVPLLSTVVASSVIMATGSEEQRKSLLPPLAAGETVATIAIFEDAHGHGTDTPSTKATREGGGWRISGVKRFVTDAPNADVFVVSAAVDGGVGTFVVAADADGVAIEPLNALDPTRPLGNVSFDVLVSDGARLGGSHTGDALARAVDLGIAMVSQEQVGLSQRCLEMSVDYAKNRFQFGRAIGSFQAIKHRCADMLVAVEHARSAAWHAAATFDDPLEASIAIPLAKSVCSDTAVKVSGDTIQVFGGIGFTWEHDAHLYFKRAKATSLLFGPVGFHRDRLADAVGI
jgi:alkylation response protein AidB-like acyl-CoA dehydrogenase